VNIRTILKAPSGTFEHAGVKTNVVVFTKDGPTQNIRFMETTKECNVVKDMFTISAEEIKSAGYSLDVGEYLVEETDNYDVPMVALGEVINLTAGYAFDVKKFNFENNGVPIIKVKNMLEKTNKIEFDEKKQPYIIKNKSYDKYIIKKGDILFSIGGSMKVGIYEFDNYSYLNQHICKIDSFDERVIKEYIKLYLIYKIIPQFSSSCQTSSIPFITLKTIKEKIQIPLPSLEVQQQIVDELSQIETSIETIESRIAQLKREKDQYKKYGRKAEIRELLKDSEEKMLGEVCDNIKTGCNKPKDGKTGTLYPYYGTGGITGYTDEYLFDGEFILTPRNGTIGVFTYTQGKIFPSDHVFVIDVNSETNKKYIYRILENFGTKLNKMKTGMGIPNITKKKLNEFKIPIPSQEIQQQCITLFEEKEKFIQSIDEKINQEKVYIDKLKQLAKDVISSFC
jgi:restriction endonuclease S subunit